MRPGGRPQRGRLGTWCVCCQRTLQKGVGLQPLPPGVSPCAHPAHLGGQPGGPRRMDQRLLDTGSPCWPLHGALPEASPQLVAPTSQRQRGREGRPPPGPLLLGVSTAVSEMNLPVPLGTWPGTVRCQRLRFWDHRTRTPRNPRGSRSRARVPVRRTALHTCAHSQDTRARHPETTAAVSWGLCMSRHCSGQSRGLGSLLRVLMAFPSPIQTPRDPAWPASPFSRVLPGSQFSLLRHRNPEVPGLLDTRYLQRCPGRGVAWPSPAPLGQCPKPNAVPVTQGRQNK